MVLVRIKLVFKNACHTAVYDHWWLITDWMRYNVHLLPYVQSCFGTCGFRTRQTWYSTRFAKKNVSALATCLRLTLARTCESPRKQNAPPPPLAGHSAPLSGDETDPLGSLGGALRQCRGPHTCPYRQVFCMLIVLLYIDANHGLQKGLEWYF